MPEAKKKATKNKDVRARVTPRMKEAVTRKIESLNNSNEVYGPIRESDVLIKLLEKWLKGEVEI
ncbi:hypothetical protein [Ruminiclostridium papyrosolvens]|nr:hypothetical protein [Ruminiclostridium papyrosolvens]